MRVGWQNLSLVEWMDPAGISALKCPMWCGMPKWERFKILYSVETLGYTAPWRNGTTFNVLPVVYTSSACGILILSHSNSPKDQNYSDSLYLACPVCALSTFGGPAAWKHTAKRWHSTLIRGSHRNYRNVTNCVPRIPILLHNGKAASCPQVSYLCIRVHFSNALLSTCRTRCPYGTPKPLSIWHERTSRWGPHTWLRSVMPQIIYLE